MDWKLTHKEELALVKALQLHFQKEAENLGAEEGFRIKKKTLNDLIIGIEPQQTDEMQ